jgi:hypothetical protein
MAKEGDDPFLANLLFLSTAMAPKVVPGSCGPIDDDGHLVFPVNDVMSGT